MPLLPHPCPHITRSPDTYYSVVCFFLIGFTITSCLSPLFHRPLCERFFAHQGTLQAHSYHGTLYLFPLPGTLFPREPLSLSSFTEVSAQRHPSPVLLPGKSHGWRSLVGCRPWVTRSRTRLSHFTFTFHFYALEKEMATHSSVLGWRIPGTEEPGGLLSMGLHRVGHN